MQIVFEFDTPYGKFCDALHFEDDAVPDDATIEAMKQDRLNNWIVAVTTPPKLDYVQLEGVKYEKIYIDGQVVLKPVKA